MSNLYRLKHIPTGLYYKPIGGSYSNLSKRGKIYQTSTNALLGDNRVITVRISEKQYNENKELFDFLGVRKSIYNSHELCIWCNKEDFEIEYIN